MIQMPLSGAQKCAVLLLLLDEGAAAALLRGLDPHEVRAVGDAMVSVAEIEPRAIDAVLDDFLAAHSEVAALGRDGAQLRDVMTQAFGAPRAATVLDRLGPPVTASPFAALAWAEPAQIAALIAADHPQVGAVILAHLPTEIASAVVGALAPKVQASVLVRLARLGPVSTATLARLEGDVEHQLRELAAARPPEARGGTSVAAKLVGQVTDPAKLLEALRGIDAELGDAIAEQLFVFADLIRIDSRGLQAVVREADPEVLVVALKGADAALRAHILTAMSQRAGAQIEDELASLPPVKREEVTAAQAKIAAGVRRLAENGALMLPGGAGYV